MKKHFVFDDEGKLIEVRGYRDDDVVVERWEIVYDESERVVGLRPLSPEEVIPQSVLDKIKFWRKPKPLMQILSIDFIGLIQYIGMIYKIKKVVTIEEIEKILEIINIKKVDVIGEITTIRDLTHRPKSFFTNPNAEQEFVGWTYENVVIDKTVYYYGDRSWKFPANVYADLRQHFPIPLGVDWMSEFYCLLAGDVAETNCMEVIYYYTDGSTLPEQFQVTEVGTWEKKTLSPTSGKYLESIRFRHLNTWNVNAWLQAITTVF